MGAWKNATEAAPVRGVVGRAVRGVVAQVMQYSPWSERTTQRMLRRYVGVPVKWMLCRYRLQQAALEIESHPGVDFADLAVRGGWYDPAPFINDFRAMLGTTPGEYAATHGS